MSYNQFGRFTEDTDLAMKAAGLVAASANGSIVDLGEGLFDGFLVVDLTAVEVASGDEKYTITVEGSTVAAMSSASVGLGSKVFGVATDPMDDNLTALGRYVIPFRNEENGEIQRYVRLRTVVAGTIATGINYSAFLAKR
tara:strand:+ start:34496 stop:34915 length:420 start_codon:yes stop_codon:yes gene_type:complete